LKTGRRGYPILPFPTLSMTYRTKRCDKKRNDPNSRKYFYSVKEVGVIKNYKIL
jgi:hypothetical protein